MFKFRYIKLDNILAELNENLETTDDKNTILDTIEVMKEYLKQLK